MVTALMSAVMTSGALLLCYGFGRLMGPYIGGALMTVTVGGMVLFLVSESIQRVSWLERLEVRAEQARFRARAAAPVNLEVIGLAAGIVVPAMGLIVLGIAMDDGHTTAIEIGRTTRLDRLLRFASAPSGGWRSVAVFGAVFGFLAGAIFAFKDYRRDHRRRR